MLRKIQNAEDIWKLVQETGFLPLFRNEIKGKVERGTGVAQGQHHPNRSLPFRTGSFHIIIADISLHYFGEPVRRFGEPVGQPGKRPENRNL